MRSSRVAAGGVLLFCAALPFGLGLLGRAAAQSSAPKGALLASLTECHVAGVREAGRCGTFTVPARSEAPSGPALALHVAVLPARGAPSEPDPVFLLAGGPGQAASDLGPLASAAFADVRKHRDIVLVDQRGTGLSGSLSCSSAEDTPYDEEASRAALRECRAKWPEDLSVYTTAAHVKDLEAVRVALGYERINLWGGSYGTRVAQEYMKAHPERLRSVVLDSVVPPSVPLTLHVAKDAQRSIELLAQACDANEACKKEVGGFVPALSALVTRLAAEPAHVTLPHPTTGKPTPVTIDGDILAGAVRQALYTSGTAVQVPFVVKEANTGNFGPFVALAESGRAAGDKLSIGLLLAVACAEDLSRVTADQVKAASTGTFVGPGLDHLFRRMCETLGPLPPAAGLDTFATVPVPTLLLSGEADPVTPPSGAEEVLRRLPRAWHFVARARGHIVSPWGCAPKVLATFYTQGHADGIDGACLEKGERPPFTLSTLGPVEASK